MNGKVEADIRNNATLFPEWLSVVLHAQEQTRAENQEMCKAENIASRFPRI
jgi:hypothetical protein